MWKSAAFATLIPLLNKGLWWPLGWFNAWCYSPPKKAYIDGFGFSFVYLIYWISQNYFNLFKNQPIIILFFKIRVFWLVEFFDWTKIISNYSINKMRYSFASKYQHHTSAYLPCVNLSMLCRHNFLLSFTIIFVATLFPTSLYKKVCMFLWLPTKQVGTHIHL